jgi:ribosome-associated protein
MREVQIKDDSIRLGQLLKLADLVDAGGDAKPLLAQGAVTVNGEVETRRGRQLVEGDVIGLGAASVRVVSGRRGGQPRRSASRQDR